MPYDLKKYLPTTRKETDLRGWDEVDIVFFTGDAYIDHPSFGAAVLGRVLEAPSSVRMVLSGVMLVMQPEKTGLVVSGGAAVLRNWPIHSLVTQIQV